MRHEPVVSAPGGVQAVAQGGARLGSARRTRASTGSPRSRTRSLNGINDDDGIVYSVRTFEGDYDVADVRA
jgi:hypothetical protein